MHQLYFCAMIAISEQMKENGKKKLLTGSIFIIWTILIQVVDKQLLGQNGTDIGFYF